MGNEQASTIDNTVTGDTLEQPPMLATLNRSSVGFHSTEYTSSTANTSVGIEDESSFQQIVIQTLKALKSNEIDAFMDAVVDEIDQQYDDNSIQQEIKNQEKNEELSFIPKQNIISNINTIYKYMRQLGSGASCRVLKARHIQNKNLYAVKELCKSHKMNSILFSKEVELLKKLNHKNILKYYDCYIDHECYYIATQYCSGGTMLDKIIRMKSFSEQKASEYIKIILSAVHYMHSLNIVHRDLKAQNMVFDKDGLHGILQLIDFGDSKIVNDKQIYSEFVGTIHYVAPEIVRPRTGKELKKSDLWSIGVITYLLVCGRPPFIGKSRKEILANIISKSKKIIYPKGIYLTDSCKDFIEGLLCDDIEDRMNAIKALKHEWISGSTASTQCLANDVLKCLKTYHYDNKLQNILINAILTEMDIEEQEILSKGILTMNRQSSNMDNNCIVDYLLLHSSIDELPKHNKDWQQQRINEVKMYEYASRKKLDLSMFASPPTSPTLKSKHISFDDDDIDWDCLNGVDVDGILDEVEQKEKELEQIEDDKNNKTINYIINIQQETISFGDDEYDEEEDEDDDIMSDDDFESKYFKLNKSYSHNSNNTMSSTASSVDFAGKRISIGRFRAIMDKSDKKYDVEDLVNDLNDGTGHIALKDIATYNKRIQTMGDLFAQNKNHQKSPEQIEKSHTM